MRVLEWILGRVDGKAGSIDSPIGALPRAQDLNLKGLKLNDSQTSQLLSVNIADWIEELTSQDEFMKSIGDKMPKELWDEHSGLKERLLGKHKAADTMTQNAAV